MCAWSYLDDAKLIRHSIILPLSWKRLSLARLVHGCCSVTPLLSVRFGGDADSSSGHRVTRAEDWVWELQDAGWRHRFYYKNRLEDGFRCTPDTTQWLPVRSGHCVVAGGTIWCYLHPLSWSTDLLIYMEKTKTSVVCCRRRGSRGRRVYVSEARERAGKKKGQRPLDKLLIT